VKIKRQITDTEFNNARQQYLPTMRNLARCYTHVLSPESLTAACDTALWRCLQSYDESFGQSFTSSLYRFIYWECTRTIKEEKCSNTPIIGDVEGEHESMAINMILDDYLSLLSNRDRRIVEARFFESCTFDEIAQREGYSKQGIKDIVDRSISVMSEAALAA